MSDPGVVTPPADPTAPPATPPAEPKAAEKKLLDELKKEREARKTAEAKLAEALPYVEKFKGHDEAKALEAQREAEARANQEKEQRAQQEIAAKKERAILRSLLGVPMPTEDAADYAFWKLANDPAVTYDPESGSFSGLTEARAKLLELPLFVAGKPSEPKKPAPGLPVPGGQPAGAGGKKYSTIAELDAEGPKAVLDFQLKYPDEYAALKAAHDAALLKPRRQMMPTPAAPQR